MNNVNKVKKKKKNKNNNNLVEQVAAVPLELVQVYKCDFFNNGIFSKQASTNCGLTIP